MSSPAADAYRQELMEALPGLERILFGLKNDSVLPQKPETLAVVQRRMAVYEQWIAAIRAVLAAMDELDGLGWPTLDPVPIPREIYADLQEDLARQTDALTDFLPFDRAAEVVMDDGTLVPKDEHAMDMDAAPEG